MPSNQHPDSQDLGAAERQACDPGPSSTLRAMGRAGVGLADSGSWTGTGGEGQTELGCRGGQERHEAGREMRQLAQTSQS